MSEHLSPEDAAELRLAQRQLEHARSGLDVAISAALGRGVPAAEVARALGVSKQAIHQRKARLNLSSPGGPLKGAD